MRRPGNRPPRLRRVAGAACVDAFQHIPAGLSLARLLAVPWIARQALHGRCGAWSGAVAGSILIDLADGMVARRIANPTALRRQRSLDSLADAVFFPTAGLGALLLRPDLLAAERGALLACSVAQAASLAACLLRFRRLPRYHTSLYRWSAGNLGLAVAGRVAGGRAAQLFRPSLLLLAAAHLEALAITLVSPRFPQRIATIEEALRYSPRA